MSLCALPRALVSSAVNKAVGRKAALAFSFLALTFLKSCVYGYSQSLSGNKSRCLKITNKHWKPGLTVAGAFKLWSIKIKTNLRGLLLAGEVPSLTRLLYWRPWSRAQGRDSADVGPLVHGGAPLGPLARVKRDFLRDGGTRFGEPQGVLSDHAVGRFGMPHGVFFAQRALGNQSPSPPLRPSMTLTFPLLPPPSCSQ